MGNGKKLYGLGSGTVEGNLGKDGNPIDPEGTSHVTWDNVHKPWEKGRTEEQIKGDKETWKRIKGGTSGSESE